MGEDCTISVNASEAGQGKVTCRIRHASGSDVDIDIQDNGDGTFSIHYTPHSPGTYTINIKFGGQQVPNGLYDVEVGIFSDIRSTPVPPIPLVKSVIFPLSIINEIKSIWDLMVIKTSEVPKNKYFMYIAHVPKIKEYYMLYWSFWYCEWWNIQWIIQNNVYAENLKKILAF